MEKKVSDLSNSDKNDNNIDNANSTGIIPELPELEPIQEVHNTQSANNDKNKNFVAIQKTDTLKDKADNDSKIAVVRFPEAKTTDQKMDFEIQQVNYEEPVMESLPDTPDVTGETRPNQWKSVNEDASTAQQEESLSILPDVIATDSASSIIKPIDVTEKTTVKKISLPKPMTDGSKPMESGVVLEDLPNNTQGTESSNLTDTNVSNTNSTEIPDEVFELPVLPEATEPSVSPNEKTPDKTTALTSNKTDDEIQQCSAIEPIQQLQMNSLTFVTSIRKKGDFTAVEKPYSFKPGQTLLLYMEIENPNSIAKLNSGFEVTDSAGKKIIAQSTSSDTPIDEPSFFQYVKFALPDDITSGDYSVRVWGKAPNDKDLATTKLSFQVK